MLQTLEHYPRAATTSSRHLSKPLNEAKGAGTTRSQNSGWTERESTQWKTPLLRSAIQRPFQDLVLQQEDQEVQYAMIKMAGKVQ